MFPYQSILSKNGNTVNKLISSSIKRHNLVKCRQLSEIHINNKCFQSGSCFHCYQFIIPKNGSTVYEQCLRAFQKNSEQLFDT